MYQHRKKNLANSLAIYGQGREIFRLPTYTLGRNHILCIWNT